MKNVLLSTVMLGGLLLMPATARAELTLDIGGHFKGYVTWIDQDEAPGQNARSFDIVRQTEIHLSAETTLDNGLTVGFHTELEVDGGDGFEVEQSSAYFSGNWGKVQFGSSDSPTYLMQIAAPSADSNVDGLRQTANAVNYTVAGPGAAAGTFDYDHVISGYADRIMYFSPVYAGVQIGVSYAPDLAAGGFANSFGNRQDNNPGGYGDALEAAIRYETKIDQFSIKLGAGYGQSDLEAPAAGQSDRESFNVGAHVGYGAFKIGASYLQDDNGVVTNGDTTTWVFGADYKTGPFTIGASYYNREDEAANAVATAFGGKTDTDRYSLGVNYAYGPGMSLRSSVHHLEHDVAGAARDIEADYVMFGTQINF